MPSRMLRVPSKQAQNITHTQLRDRLAALDGRGREFAFLGLKVEDPFFDGVGDGEAVDCYVDGLVEAVDAVDCLFFYELCGEKNG